MTAIPDQLVHGAEISWLVVTKTQEQGRICCLLWFCFIWLQPLWQHVLVWWQWRGWFIVVYRSQGVLLVSKLITDFSVGPFSLFVFLIVLTGYTPFHIPRAYFLGYTHTHTRTDRHISDGRMQTQFSWPCCLNKAACCRRGACVHFTSQRT